MQEELKQRARDIIERLSGLDSSKRPGGGVHGQVIGMEPYIIRTTGDGLGCLYEAQELINELLDPFDRRTPVSGEVAEGLAVAWRRADGGEFNLTDDPEVAAYWTRKGCAVTPLVAQGIDHAKLAEGAGSDPIHEFAMLAIGTVFLRCGQDEAEKLAETYRQARGQQAGGAEE